MTSQNCEIEQSEYATDRFAVSFGPRNSTTFPIFSGPFDHVVAHFLRCGKSFENSMEILDGFHAVGLKPMAHWF